VTTASPGSAARLLALGLGTTAVAAASALALGGVAAGTAVLLIGVAGLAIAGVGGLLTPPVAVDGPERAEELARAAEAAAAEAVDRTWEILDALPRGLVVVGPDGRVQHANRALRELLGLQRDPVGLLPLEALHAVELAEAIDEAAAGREPAPRDVAVAERDLSVIAHPLAGGGVIALLRDVSADRLLERARTDFVANVSHELRTPVAAILGFSETLLDTPGGLPPEIATMGRAIQRNATRLRKLFEDLLALHRIETRRHEPPRSDVRLAPLLAEALVSAADAAASKGVAFDVDVAEDLSVRANPEALSAIVANLAANACKYTPSGGRVTVSAEVADDGVRVDVVDTGIGIPRAHHPRVFERFYRVDEGRAREVGGTGLGLAIAKHLAESTGCRITLQSEEGHGSTFSVHVPGTVRTPRAP
jgi:two-component system phosphate regulon sensor histidine kinase PhoR